MDHLKAIVKFLDEGQYPEEAVGPLIRLGKQFGPTVPTSTEEAIQAIWCNENGRAKPVSKTKIIAGRNATRH